MHNRMSDPVLPALDAADLNTRSNSSNRLLRARAYPLLVVASLMLSLLVSDQVWGRTPHLPIAEAQVPGVATKAREGSTKAPDVAALLQEVNPPEGHQLSVSYGDLGPRLLQSGAIDYDQFAAVYATAGNPLTQAQINILRQGSSESIVITPENAHFLLNFFWAVGLVNENSILTQGPLAQYAQGRIDGFASTGGWTLGSKPVTELFASMRLIELTPGQQDRVEEVASAVYRPCCDNPTLFPDCNHGMAMLGLLELMASQDASVDDMWTAAKYVNAYWFPAEAIETAIYLRANKDVDFSHANPRMVTGRQLSSGSGFGLLHAELESKGLLPQSPDNGGSCRT